MSLTLARLPRANENSNSVLRENEKKTEEVSENMGFI